MLPPQSSAAPPEKDSPPGDLPDLPDGVRGRPPPGSGVREHAAAAARAGDLHARAGGAGCGQGAEKLCLCNPAGQAPHLGGWVPAAHPDGGREGQAGGGGSVLPLARRGLRTPRRGERPVGGGRRWRARHQADKRARRPDHRPGSGGGRAPGHAASGHRHRDGRLGPPGGRDAAAARRIPRQRAAAAAAARGWAAAGAGAQDHPR